MAHDTFSYLLPDLPSLVAESRVFLFMMGQRDIYQLSAEASDSVECDFEAESELYSFHPSGQTGTDPRQDVVVRLHQLHPLVLFFYLPSNQLTSTSLSAKVVPHTLLPPLALLLRRNDLKIELL